LAHPRGAAALRPPPKSEIKKVVDLLTSEVLVVYA
jgi:hypothetical protein